MDLVIQHLWKTYPNGTTALRDVSLTIPPGMFGLLGPNGAGKSTLMRILATLQEAESGTVRLGDIDVLRHHDAVRRTLGYLPQEFGLYPRIAAEDMLDHFGLLKGLVNARERRETVHALLQQTNLWHARRQKLGSFSGGMRQRFGIAVALIGRPRLIIVDEPTAGLDPAERARFLNLLSELGESAVVILSTHIVEDVSELCTRMAIISGGRILLEGEPAGAVEAMRGRVWRRQVDRAELPGWERALPLISTTLVGGRTVIHVFADAPPDPTFEPVEPDLKDVYFTVIKGIQIAPGMSPDPQLAPAAAFVTRVMGGEPDAPPPVQPSGAPLHPTDVAPGGWPADAPLPPRDAGTAGAPAEPPSFQPTPIDGAIQHPAGERPPSTASAKEEVPPPPAPPSTESSASTASPPSAPPSTGSASTASPPPAHEEARGGPGAAHVPFFGEWAGPRLRADDDPERGEGA